MMKLENYFTFINQDDIRIKGTRIGIETILYDYIHRKQHPEDIVTHYPTLTLEQVYTTILYYLQNKEKIAKYLADWLEFGKSVRKEQDRNPPPVVVKLRNLKTSRKGQLTS